MAGISSYPSTRTVSYTVNANGNVTARGSDSFGYDQANRLTSATVGGTTTTYRYDGDGKRASQAVGGSTTNYAYDVNASLPDVLTDGTLKYVYGLGLAFAVDTAGNVQVYHADGLGSVRAITDGAGTLIQTYQTYPFGVPTQTQGSSTQPFQFTGQQRDGNGLIYLRARYYDPAAGRFLSRDLDAGSRWQPTSLARYVYALDQPVDQVDPSGLRSKVKKLPVLVIDADKMPEKAKHIVFAQAVLGYPKVLTRDTDTGRRDDRRESVCKGWNLGPLSCDEYPFASTYEGGDATKSSLGRTASTFPIPRREQSIEGGTILQFYRNNQVGDGDKFIVEVRFSTPPVIPPVPAFLPEPGVGETTSESDVEPVAR